MGQIVDGRYRIEEDLGQGMLGPVFKARNLGDNRAYVLKLLQGSSEEDVRDLHREAQLLWSVGHPLVRLPREVFVVSGTTVLALDYVEGERVDAQPRSLEFIAALLDQVTGILTSVHSAGIVHGDIKPGNLLYDSGGEFRLIDFGLARLQGVRDDTMGGTPGFMAPEVWQRGQLSPAADWYGLGAVAYLLLTGAVPPPGATAPVGSLQDRVSALLSEDPELRSSGITAEIRGPIAFVGRETECRTLREWATLPGPGVLCVVGVGGVGKSRLMREALHSFGPLSSRCFPFDGRPYAGLGFLGPVLGHPPDTAGWVSAQVSQAGSLDEVALSVRTLLCAHCQPTVVVIEEAGRLGPDALSFLRVVLSGARGSLRLVLEARPGEVEDLSDLIAVSQGEYNGYTTQRMAVGPLPGFAGLADTLAVLSPSQSTVLQLLATHPPGLSDACLDAALGLLGQLRPSEQRAFQMGLIMETRNGLALSARAVVDHVLAQLTGGRRRRLHRVVLDALTLMSAPAEECVPHLAALGDLQRAARLAQDLAARAELEGAYGAAAEWFSKARSWLGDDSHSLILAQARMLEGAGRVNEAAELYLAEGRVQDASRCWFDGGRIDRAIQASDDAFRAAGVTASPSAPRLVLSVIGGLAWLATRRTLQLHPPDPGGAGRAELLWLLARGTLMETPGRSLAASLAAVRCAVRSGHREIAGRALAFVAGGVFLQLPGFRAASGRLLAQVRDWGDGPESDLGAMADLWEAIAGVSRGEWGRAMEVVDRAEATLRRSPDTHFERFAARQCQLLGLRHVGRYGRLLDLSLIEIARARDRGDGRAEAVFSTFAVDGFLAAGQSVPVRGILERFEAWLPSSFTPQHADFVESVCNLDLAEGAADAAWSRYTKMQPPFRRAGGNLAAVSRMRNARLGGRIAMARGDRDALRRASRELSKTARPDAAVYARWFSLVVAGSAQNEATALASAFRDVGAEALALAFELQVREHPDAERGLRGLGVAHPLRWSRWMAPLNAAPV